MSQREWVALWVQPQVWGWLGMESSWGWARREMEPRARSLVSGCRLEGSQAGVWAWGRTASSQVLACSASSGWAQRAREWWASSQVSALGWPATGARRQVWVRAQPERVGVALLRSVAS